MPNAHYIAELAAKSDSISNERARTLAILASRITDQLIHHSQANVLIVCTHNSRRSQLFQLWLAAIAHQLNIEGINALSAGTEATAFNHRMVASLKRKGFDLIKVIDSNNPTYHLSIDHKTIPFYSKTITEISADRIIAVMVCDDADQNCPMIPSALYRISMPYIDPKYADDTSEEAMIYDHKVDEIGSEVLHMMRLVKELLQKKKGN